MKIREKNKQIIFCVITCHMMLYSCSNNDTDIPPKSGIRKEKSVKIEHNRLEYEKVVEAIKSKEEDSRDSLYRELTRIEDVFARYQHFLHYLTPTDEGINQNWHREQKSFYENITNYSFQEEIVIYSGEESIQRQRKIIDSLQLIVYKKLLGD